MRNITVSVDDLVYQRASAKAAELGTSLSALVQDFLTRLAPEEREPEALEPARRKQLQQEILASLHAFRAGDRLDREAAHERGAANPFL